MPGPVFVLIAFLLAGTITCFTLLFTSPMDTPAPKPIPYCRVVQPIIPSPTPISPPTIPA